MAEIDETEDENNGWPKVTTHTEKEKLLEDINHIVFIILIGENKQTDKQKNSFTRSHFFLTNC